MEILQPLFALLLITIARPAPDLLEAAAIPPPRIHVLESWVAVALYLALVFASTRAAVRSHRASARRGLPFHLPGLVSAAQFAMFALLVFATDWVRLASAMVLGIPFLSLILAFSPFVAARALRSVAAYEAERDVPNRQWTRREYVVFHLRVLALPVVPLILVNGLQDAALRSTVARAVIEAYGSLVVTVGVLAMIPLVFALSPAFVRWILGAKPLPPGSLRTRLERYGRRSGFRPSDILVWNTGRTVTNALYIGIVPRFRYVVLTDALILTMDEPAIEAVYAHEAGHGMRKHTVLFLVMAMALLFWTGVLNNEFQQVAQELAVAPAFFYLLQILIIAGPLAVFLLVGLGWVSRRFETEADLHAVKTLEEPSDFSRALETIGLHMGVMRRGGGLRHFGIGRRLGLINRYLCEPDFRGRFDGLLRRLRIGVVAAFAAGALGFAIQVPAFQALGRVRLLVQRAERSGDAELLHRAAAEAREAGAASRAGSIVAREVVAALAGCADREFAKGRYDTVPPLLEEMRRTVQETDRIGHINIRNFEFLLQALDQRGDPEPVGRLVTELCGYRTNPSALLTASDLHLAYRALGGTGDADITGFSPAARLLAYVEAPDHDPASEKEGLAPLLEAARKDVVGYALRRDLLRLAAERHGLKERLAMVAPGILDPPER